MLNILLEAMLADESMPLPIFFGNPEILSLEESQHHCFFL